MRRKQKILRNSLCCLLLCLLIYAALDFPVYTVSAMCRQMKQTILLPEEPDPLLVVRDSKKYSNEWLRRRRTYIIARSGEQYLHFQYERYGLDSQQHDYYGLDLTEGGFVSARRGKLYAAGDFEGGVRATASVTLTSKDSRERTFAYEGKREGEDVFSFHFSDEDSTFAFWLDEKSEEEMNLVELTQLWYRTPHEGSSGYGYDHADIPVRITVYDGAGEVLTTLDRTVDTYDIHSWF